MTDRSTLSMTHTQDDEPNVEALAALADGLLADEPRRLALEHVASCDRCRTIVSELARGAIDRRAPVSWARAALPIAASITVAIAAGGVFWLTRGELPASRTPSISEPASPTPAAPPSAPAVPSTAPRVEPPDAPRAASSRTIAGKTFTLVAGEWIDAGYSAATVSDVVDIRSAQEFASHPELMPFATLGRRFTVALAGTAYRVDLPNR